MSFGVGATNRRIGFALVALVSLSFALPTQAAPPSRAFLRLVGAEARELEPALAHRLRQAEIDFQWRGRVAGRLAQSVLLAQALERAGLDASLQARSTTTALTATRRQTLQVDPRGTLAELLERYVWQGAINLPERMMRELGPVRTWSAGEVVDEVFVRRAQLADELEELAEQFLQTHSRLSREITAAARRIRVSERELQRVNRIHAEFPREAFDPNRHGQMLRGFGSVVPGELGELLVFARENQALERGLLAPELALHLGASPAARAAAQAIQAEAGHPAYNHEIDLLFEGLRGIGEVKTYQDVVALGDHSFHKVYAQAQNLRDLRDRLWELPAVRNYVGAEGIRLRIYFMGGIDDAARAEFEKIGFEVYGAGESSTRTPLRRAS